MLGQARSTQRRIPKCREDEEALRQDVVKVARRFGRYGYRMVTGMLRTERYAFPRVGKLPVSEVTSADMLEILAPIWHTKAETEVVLLRWPVRGRS